MNTKSPARFVCENLQYEILSWLPPKSLLRYSSVSKSWYSTIHDPSFIKKHTENQSRNDYNRAILVIPNTRPSTICRLYSGKTCEVLSTFNLPITPVDEFGWPKVVSSCDGLLCFVDHSHDDLRLHIWNPSIRFLKLLPPCNSNILPSPYIVSSFGIGFHSPSNDYRVVRLTHYFRVHVKGRQDVIRTEAEVFSLSTDSWRMVNLDGCVIRQTRKGSGSVSVNGYIYWLATERRILSFKTNNDSFEEILHPYGSGSHLKIYQIAVVRGRLCLLIEPYFGSLNSGTEDQEHEIWMMTEHGVYESWTKLWNIRQAERFSDTFGITVKGELLQFTGVGHKNLCVYDHEDLRYYDLYKSNVAAVVCYMESLVSLDTQRGARIDKKRKFSTNM